MSRRVHVCPGMPPCLWHDGWQPVGTGSGGEVVQWCPSAEGSSQPSLNDRTPGATCCGAAQPDHQHVLFNMTASCKTGMLWRSRACKDGITMPVPVCNRGLATSPMKITDSPPGPRVLLPLKTQHSRVNRHQMAQGHKLSIGSGKMVK